MDVKFEFINGKTIIFYGVVGFYKNGKKIRHLFEGIESLLIGQFTVAYDDEGKLVETVINGDDLKTVTFGDVG